MSKEIHLVFGFVFSNLVFLPSVFAGFPKDNADHLLFGGGFSLGTTLCELTSSKDISINRAIEFRDKYMSEWDKEEAVSLLQWFIDNPRHADQIPSKAP